MSGSRSNIDIIEDKMDEVLRKYAEDQRAAIRKNKGHTVAPSAYLNYAEMAGEKLSISKFDINELRKGELGERVRIAAGELAKELKLPEIKTVRGLYEYVQKMRPTPIMQSEDISDMESDNISDVKLSVLSDQAKLATIKSKVGDVLGGYKTSRFSLEEEKKYSGTMFGYTQDDKKTAVSQLENLLQGEGHVYKTSIPILRDGRLGRDLRETARELAKELNMPELGTVRGLIKYLHEQTLIEDVGLDDEKGNKHK